MAAEGFAATVARRRQVFTMGQRINISALSAYVILLGLTYALASPRRYTATAFVPLKFHGVTMRDHGIVFITLGVIVMVCYLRGMWIEYALAIMGGYHVMFAGAFIYAALTFPTASPSGIWPYLFIAASCIASIASTVQAKREAYLDSKLVTEYEELLALAEIHRRVADG